MSVRRGWLVGLAIALPLAGCSSDVVGEGSFDRAAATAAGPGIGPHPDVPMSTVLAAFAAGLLPPTVFGPDAVAEPLPTSDRDHGDPGQLPDGAVRSDPDCATSREPSGQTPDGYAGQSVIVGRNLYVQTVQSPFKGTPHDPRTYADGLDSCETGSFTLADGSRVTLTFSALELGELGDLRGGRRVDSVVVTANGQSYTSATLTADVVDGERVCSLAVFSLVPNAPVDETSFRTLVTAAFEHQHAALG